MDTLRNVIVVGAALAVGCVGSPEYAGSSSGLTERDSSVEPLESFAAPWGAARGCEGLLTERDALTFEIASLEDGLVAALDASGDVLCVDTVESVQAELQASGHDDDAETLGRRFDAAVRAAFDGDVLPAISGATAPGAALEDADRGDPTPQPNSDPRR
jgi:hypothetical protein